MTERATPNSEDLKTPYQKVLAGSYYELLGLHPSASAREIRQAYRDLSKLYHPDTTKLPTAIATTQFQKLNEAYATLSSPERRSRYDRKIGYSSVAVVQSLPNLHCSSSPKQPYSSSAYLDPTDRPLSPGEIFALFILGLTFIGCLCLAIAIGLTRGDAMLQTATVQKDAARSAIHQTVQPAVAKPAMPQAPTLQQSTPPQPIPSISSKDAAPTVPPLSITPSLPTKEVPDRIDATNQIDANNQSTNAPLPSNTSQLHASPVPEIPT